MVGHCFSLLSIAYLDWRNRVGSKRLRGLTRDEGFAVSWTGCGGMFGGLVRWPVNTDDCMTRPMMQGECQCLRRRSYQQSKSSPQPVEVNKHPRATLPLC